MTKSNPVQILINDLKNSGFKLEVIAATTELSRIDYREIELTNGAVNITIPVFDEYKDCELNNPVVWYHLILEAMEYFEEAKSPEDWFSDIGIREDELSYNIYHRLMKIVPIVRNITGSTAKAISDYDIQFNTHIAKALRACQASDIAD